MLFILTMLFLFWWIIYNISPSIQTAYHIHIECYPTHAYLNVALVWCARTATSTKIHVNLSLGQTIHLTTKWGKVRRILVDSCHINIIRSRWEMQTINVTLGGRWERWGQRQGQTAKGTWDCWDMAKKYPTCQQPVWFSRTWLIDLDHLHFQF